MRYKCKHAVARWFAAHGEEFTTNGPNIALPAEGTVAEGEWALFSDGEFLGMDNEAFIDTFEAVP